MTRMRHLSQKM